MVREPRLMPEMLCRSMPAARHLLAAGSAKNSGKRADFPRTLEAAELLGLLQGPFAYLYSWWRYRAVAGTVASRRTVT
jgi:hypothetical protein